MAPLHGLVLAGGASSRMGQDKAALLYHDRPQLERAFALLASQLTHCFISVRPDQARDPLRAPYPVILDDPLAEHGISGGPLSGILAAHGHSPDAAWLVLACDLPMLDGPTLAALIAGRDASRCATAFQSEHDGLPEPLCTIWEPEGLRMLSAGGTSLRRVLGQGARILPPFRHGALDNVNTPAERMQALQRLSCGARDVG